MKKKIIYYVVPFFVFTFLYIFSFSLVPKYFFDIPLLGPVGILLFLSIVMIGILKLISEHITCNDFDIKDICIIAITFFFINYNVYGMIPFNVSRSNSILILGYLLQHD